MTQAYVSKAFCGVGLVFLKPPTLMVKRHPILGLLQDMADESGEVNISPGPDTVLENDQMLMLI